MGARYENNGRKTAHGGAVNIYCLLTEGRHFICLPFLCRQELCIGMGVFLPVKTVRALVDLGDYFHCSQT